MVTSNLPSFCSPQFADEVLQLIRQQHLESQLVSQHYHQELIAKLSQHTGGVAEVEEPRTSKDKSPTAMTSIRGSARLSSISRNPTIAGCSSPPPEPDVSLRVSSPQSDDCRGAEQLNDAVDFRGGGVLAGLAAHEDPAETCSRYEDDTASVASSTDASRPPSQRRRSLDVRGALQSLKDNLRAKPTGHLADVLHPRDSESQSWFDTVIGVLVILNAAVMMLDLELHGASNAVLLGLQGMHDSQTSRLAVTILEHSFNVIFVLELTYRVRQTRLNYFKSALNVFDLLIVLTTSIDIYVLTPLTSTSLKSVALWRLLRLTRIVRTLRLVRTLKLFKGLRVLVKACSSFLISLCWSMVILSLLMLMSGLMIGNLLLDFIADAEQDLEWRIWVWNHYGTSYRAIYTLFEVTFAGNWPNYARPILERVGRSYCIFYILYISVVVFAIKTVISAIFLRDTLETANDDAEMIIQERQAKQAAYVVKLGHVFAAVDSSGDGTITKDEMNAIFKDDMVRTYLQALEFEVHDGMALFELLDDGDGKVTYDEFINGITRFKGSAKAADLMIMHIELRELSQRLEEFVRQAADSSAHTRNHTGDAFQTQRRSKRRRTYAVLTAHKFAAGIMHMV